MLFVSCAYLSNHIGVDTAITIRIIFYAPQNPTRRLPKTTSQIARTKHNVTYQFELGNSPLFGCKDILMPQIPLLACLKHTPCTNARQSTIQFFDKKITKSRKSIPNEQPLSHRANYHKCLISQNLFLSPLCFANKNKIPIKLHIFHLCPESSKEKARFRVIDD